MKKSHSLLIILILLKAPIFSQEWFVQNTTLTTHELYSIDFITENTGWVVGRNGTILNTTDGGNSWIDHSRSYSNYAVDFIDENVGYIVGSELLVRRTTDGGNTWVNQVLGSGGQVLYSVFFVNKDTGWTVGYPGIILKTTNGGIDWISQMDTLNVSLNSVYFLNDTIGFIAGDDYILKTLNAGEEWIVSLYDYTEYLEDICFSDENFGYAVGYHHNILKTTDGGNIWEKIYSHSSDSFLRSVNFINQDTGWVAGNGAIFRKTTNGGTSWNDVSLGINGYNDILYSVYFINDNIGWVTGNEGKLFKTTDGGTTWQSKSSPLTSEHLNSVFFVDSKLGWIAGENGTILHTTNSGSNWTKQSISTLNNLYSIFFVDKNTGWCAGTTIHKTTDSGNNWVYQYTPSAANSIYFLDENHGWAACNDGRILKTTNGEDWVIKITGTNFDFYAIQFVTKDTGWVSGKNTIYVPGYGSFDDRRILKTLDGGETWFEVHRSSSYDHIYVADIFFIDQNVGWACNQEYYPMIKTTDGGNTWIELNFRGGRSIKFVNENIGWVCKETDGIYRTTDGGITWNLQHTGVTTPVNSVYLINDSTGWVVGGYGTILSTKKNQNGEDDSIDTQTPSEYNLAQNYPNPFNPATTIMYEIPQYVFVTLKVYDILGREVAKLVNEEKPAGTFNVEFDGKALTSGIYFYQLKAGNYSETKKMILLK